MKVFAHHDSKGNISALVAIDAPKEAGLMLVPKAGFSVLEIAGLTVKSGEKGVEELIEIARTHVVKTPQPVKLMRKGS
jgi:hypothetical protein